MIAEFKNGKLALKSSKEVLPHIDKSYEMNFSYVRKDETSIIKHKDQNLLTNGNMLLLISRAGSGKSNIMEALAANALNPYCDAFGFDVNIGNDGMVCLIDTERTYNDLHKGFNRILNRARIEGDGNFVDDVRIKRCHLYSYKLIDDIDAFIKNLWHHCEQGYRLILIDQIADFLADVNNIVESKMLTRELEKMGAKFDNGIVMTIHPNPKDPDHKATGHLGSFLQKKCESVLACMKADDDTRIITTKFSQGKVRNGFDIETGFMWDDDLKMFIGTELSKKVVDKVSRDNQEMDAYMEEIFETSMSVTAEDMVRFIREKKNDKNIKKQYIDAYMKSRNTICLDMLGNYQKNTTELFDDAPF